jgi:Sushi repeat (SCR repeat)
VPVNSIVEESEPYRRKLKCVEGFDLIGNDVITCNQINGQWSPIPVCGLNESPASNSIGIGTIIGAIIGIIFLIVGVAAIIGFFYFKRFVLVRLLIIPIKHKCQIKSSAIGTDGRIAMMPIKLCQ